MNRDAHNAHNAHTFYRVALAACVAVDFMREARKSGKSTSV
jgi:hypothetical protein